jgi:hypothetical protein
MYNGCPFFMDRSSLPQQSGENNTEILILTHMLLVFWFYFYWKSML